MDRRGIFAIALLSSFASAICCVISYVMFTARNGPEAGLALNSMGIGTGFPMVLIPFQLLGDLVWKPLPGILFLLMAASFAAAGLGLWRLSPSARRLEIALLWIATTVLAGSGLTTLILGKPKGLLPLTLAIGCASAVWYLSKADVLAAFGAPEGTRSRFALSLVGSLAAAVVLFGGLMFLLLRSLAGLR